MDPKNLIFIASQPRAGSTYLQNLVSNNPHCNTVSEPWIMLYLAPLIAPHLIEASYDYELTIDAVEHYGSKFEVPDRISLVRHNAMKFYRPLFSDFKYVVDKTPRYWEILNELAEVFPESKIIVLIRNPIDVAKSMIQTWKVRNSKAMTKHKRDLLDAPLAISAFLERHSDNPNVKCIYYEDLLKNPDYTIRDAYSWIGLPYESSVLDHGSNIKFRGKYGDPYSNGSLAKKEQFMLSREGKQFLLGYADYIKKHSPTFYNRYDFSISSETLAFKRLLKHDEYQASRMRWCKILKCKIRNSFIFRHWDQFIRESHDAAQPK